MDNDQTVLSQPGEPRSQPNSGSWAGAALRDMVGTIVPAIVIALLIHLFLAQATRVYGQSMEPNLHTNQRLVVEKLSYRFHGPQRFDVVVLKVASQGDELLIKRVIGLPGETVEIQDGHVYINGQPLDEPYLVSDTRPGRQGRIVVPPLHVFVLGDNRGDSRDSRYFGAVPLEAIRGHVVFILWPPAQAQAMPQ